MHDREQIVEVVRDAAGQLADGLHLLRLAQRLLGLLARLVLRFQLARALAVPRSSSVSVKARSCASARLRSVTSTLTPTTRTGAPAAS